MPRAYKRFLYDQRSGMRDRSAATRNLEIQATYAAFYEFGVISHSPRQIQCHGEEMARIGRFGLT